MNTRYALAAAAAAALIAGPALARPAQTEDAPRQAAVSYADLNLSTAQGQTILVSRIHQAAEAVCGGAPDSRDVKAQMTFRRCMKQSVDTAVAAIPSATQLAGDQKLALK
jgi:UrcA family protein